MSGPVSPPLTVTTVGGTPSGRPITTIKVSNGDLTISGNTATIDTSGGGGGSGTVTSITFSSPLTGGTITTSGTVGITTVHTGSSFTDNDTSLMTAGAIKEKIEDYGYSTTTGDITGVTLTADDTNTASDTSGSADFTIAGGEGIDTSVSGTTVTIAGELATTSNKGVASFSSNNFDVSSGEVSIKDEGVDEDQLANASITYAKIQNMTDARMLGNNSGGAAAPSEMTKANVLSFLNVADGAGVAPTNYITNNADDTMAGALTIDKDSTATTSGTTRGLYLDYDHTGITASGQSINNVGMDLNVNCSSVTHVGSHTSYGIKGSVTSSTTGTGTAYGMTMGVTGGDTNIGILTNVTDGGIDFKAKSTANADDYFTMATGTNGATTLTTVDDDATAANLLFDIDGDITLDAHGKNVYIAYNGTSIYDFDINNQSLKIMDSSDTGDYFEIAVANHGATTITTVDDDAANGNLTLDADGNLILDAGASNQIDFKLGGASYAKMSAQEFYLYNMLDTPDDYFKITMGNNGAAILSTNDDSGANGHLSIQPNGHVEFDNCGVGFDLVTPTFNAADTNVDFKTGNKQMVTLTDNIADLNLTFPATSGNFTLLLKQDGSGNHTMATDGWLAFESDGSAATVPAVKFPGGTAPTLTTAANHVDIVSFFWDADNQVCYGVVSLDFQD